MKFRLMFISNLYPNPLFPNMASFNRQQIMTLNKLCEIDVISPVPWTAFLQRKRPALCRTEDGITIHHPVYYYTPRVFRNFYGTFFLNSIQSTASRLLETKKFDIIYSSWLYPDSLAAARLAKQYGLPLFVKVHGSDVNLLKPGTVIARQSMAVVEQAQKVICVSKALKNRLIELGAPENKLEVLYNGVDRSIFHPMDRQEVRHGLNIESDDFVILFVGNLKQDKGLDELLAACNAFHNTIKSKLLRLVIIGTGPYESVTKKQVTELGLNDKVSFLGSQPLSVIARWMNAASVLCLPSYMEGVPNVVLEALSCGLRVIATRVGGIPELDDGSKCIRLIDPKSFHQLQVALEQLSHDGQSLIPYGGTIRSWQENAERMFAIFKSAV